MLTLLAGPPEEPISVVDAKTHLAVAHDGHDAMIARLISVARARVEAHTGRALVSQVWQMTFPYFPRAIELPRPPTLAVSSLTYIDPTGATVPMVEDVDFRVVPGGRLGRTKILPPRGATFPSTQTEEPQAVTVTFRAGFAPDDGESPTSFIANVPPEFSQAILMLTASLYANRDNVSPAPLTEIPDGVAALLSDWTDWFFA